MRSSSVIALAALISACSTMPRGSNDWIEPMDAIRAANDDPLYGVRGQFVLTVKAIGSQDGRTYLNSEKDYRDQRCLTIEVPSSMVPRLEQRLGVKLQDVLGRRVVVLGVAKRTRIDFVRDDRPTGKYYYQTHVKADSPTQVEFAD